MAIQDKYIYGATTVLHDKASTATVANNTMSAESAEFTSTEHSDYPMGEFELDITFSTAPSFGKSIDLYVRDQSLDGTGKSPAPATTYKRRKLASFYPDTVTTQQFLRAIAILPKEGTVYLFNNGTFQDMPAAAWGLKVRYFGHGV